MDNEDRPATGDASEPSAPERSRRAAAAKAAPFRHGHRHQAHPLSAAEVTAVAAICNRYARLRRGTVDRDALFLDFEIVQSHCPLNLVALASAPDRVFLEEMAMIGEYTDRTTRSLRGGFESRFMSGQ
ncbi:MAG: hypothetical protein V2I82_10475 [Halieaceae bacterium]|jgi:hypothetical protein|nr:hypothetical protein [Halieaceae bacterium]